MAAILFKVEAAVRLGYSASTSNECCWNQLFKDKVYIRVHTYLSRSDYESHIQPARINFSNPKNTRVNQPPAKRRKLSIPIPTKVEEDSFLKVLATISPSSALLTAVCKKKGANSEVVTACLPPTMSSLFDPKYSLLTPTELAVECHRVFSSMKLNEEDAKYLADATKLQSLSLVWHEHRKGRLTASRFGSICHTNPDTPSRSLVASILAPQPLSTPAIHWGVEKPEMNTLFLCRGDTIPSQLLTQAFMSIHSVLILEPHLMALSLASALERAYWKYSVHTASDTLIQHQLYILRITNYPSLLLSGTGSDDGMRSELL